MAKLTRLTSQIRDDFVAYLDGELDEAQTQRIESILGQNAVARTEMESLAKTYELLDTLERPRASDDFAERTMAAIRVDQLRADPRDSQVYKGAQAGLVCAVWVAALLATVAVGYLAANRWLTTETDRLVQDLPLIEQLDLYTEVGDVEFLQRLAANDALLSEMHPTSAEPASAPVPAAVDEPEVTP